MGLTYSLFLVIFATVVPLWWVNNIGNLLPYKALYVLFFINLLICEIKWIPAIIRKCRKPSIEHNEEGMKVHRIELQPASSGYNFDGLKNYFRRRGYKVQLLEGGNAGQDSHSHAGSSLFVYRGRFSPLGNILFHLAFLLIVAGVYFSIFYRFEGTVHLIEGQKFEGTYGEYSNLVAGPAATFMDAPFEVLEIKPKFWGRELLFTELIGRLKSIEGIQEATLSSAASIGGASVTLSSISYACQYTLKDKNGKELDKGIVNLSNFSPGSSDSFQVPGYPYKIFISVYPDAEIRGGNLVNKSMNLTNPAYYVRIVKNKNPVFSGIVPVKGSAHFDGFQITFPNIHYNGTFNIKRDPGEWFYWIAFILMCLGLIIRLLFFKREIHITEHGHYLDFHARSDYHSQLFVARYDALLKSIV
jgi:hypothetical protein